MINKTYNNNNNNNNNYYYYYYYNYNYNYNNNKTQFKSVKSFLSVVHAFVILFKNHQRTKRNENITPSLRDHQWEPQNDPVSPSQKFTLGARAAAA